MMHYGLGTRNLEDTTILLDENNARPLFAANEPIARRTDRQDTFWNRLGDAMSLLFKGTTSATTPATNTTAFTNNPTYNPPAGQTQYNAGSTFYNNPTNTYTNTTHLYTQPTTVRKPYTSNYTTGKDYNNRNWNYSSNQYKYNTNYNNGFTVRNNNMQ